MNIHAHLTFNGDCRQAMTFYQKCLGGKLTFQTVGESPLSAKMPAKMKNCIVQATLTKNSFVLMGSDMVSEYGLIKGNAVALALHCNSEDELKTAYQKLSAGGSAAHPLEYTFWGAMVGGVTDRFGNHWLIHFHQLKKDK
jgi:PhnB protein